MVKRNVFPPVFFLGIPERTPFVVKESSGGNVPEINEKLYGPEGPPTAVSGTL